MGKAQKVMDSCFSTRGAILCLILSGDPDRILAMLCLSEDRECVWGVGKLHGGMCQDLFPSIFNGNVGCMGYAYHFVLFALVTNSFVIIDLSQPSHPYFEIWSADLIRRFHPLKVFKFDSWPLCLIILLTHPRIS